MPPYSSTTEDLLPKDAIVSQVRGLSSFEKIQNQGLNPNPSAAKRQSTSLPEPAPKRQQTTSPYHSIPRPAELQFAPSADGGSCELPRSRHSAYVVDGVGGNVGTDVGKGTGEDVRKGTGEGTEQDTEKDIEEDILENIEVEEEVEDEVFYHFLRSTRSMRIPRNPHAYSEKSRQPSAQQPYSNAEGSDSDRRAPVPRPSPSRGNLPQNRGPPIYEGWNQTYNDRVKSRRMNREMDSAEALAETLKLIAPNNALELAREHLSPESKEVTLAKRGLGMGFARLAYGVPVQETNFVLHGKDGRGGDSGLNGDSFRTGAPSGASELSVADMERTVGELPEVDMHDEGSTTLEQVNAATNEHKDTSKGSLENPRTAMFRSTTFTEWAETMLVSQNADEDANVGPSNQDSRSKNKSRKSSACDKKSTTREPRISKISTNSRALKNMITPEEYKMTATEKESQGRLDSIEQDIRLQREAASRIEMLEKQRKVPGSVGELFGEPPEGEDSKVRREQMILREKKLKGQKEDMQIIEEMRLQTKARLEVASKRRANEEAGERRAERRGRLTESKEENARKEAERVERRRKSVAERMEEEQFLREAERLVEIEKHKREALLEKEKLDKLVANLQAAKERATSLKPCKMTKSKATPGSTPDQPAKPVETAGIINNDGDDGGGDGMFVPEGGLDSPANVTAGFQGEDKAGEHVDRSENAAENALPSATDVANDTNSMNTTSASDVTGAINDTNATNAVNSTIATNSTNAAGRITRERINSYRPPHLSNADTIRGRQGWRVARETDIIGRRVEELAVKMAEDKYKRMKAELEACVREREIRKLQESMGRERQLLQGNGERLARLERLIISQQKEKATEKKRAERDRIEWEKREKRMGRKLEEVKKIAEKEVAALREKNEKAKQSVSLLARMQDNLFTSEVRILSQVEIDRAENKEWNRKFTIARRNAVRRIRRKIVSSLQGEGEVHEDRVTEHLDAEMAQWEENYRKKKPKDTTAKGPIPSFTKMMLGDTKEGTQSETPNYQVATNTPKIPTSQDENEGDPPVRGIIDYIRERDGVNVDFARAAAVKNVNQLGTVVLDSDSDSDSDDDMPAEKAQFSQDGEKQGQYDDDSTSQPLGSQHPDSKDGRDFEPHCHLEVEDKPQVNYSIADDGGEDHYFSIEDYFPMVEDTVVAYKVVTQTTRGTDETSEIVLKVFLTLEEANKCAQQAIRTIHWGPDETFRSLSEQIGNDNLYAGKIVMGEKGDLIERVWVKREVTYTGNISGFDKRDIDFSNFKKRRAFVTTIITPGADGQPDIKFVGIAYVREFANYRAARKFLELVKPKTANIDLVQQYTSETVPMVLAEVERSNEQDADLEFEGEGVVVRVDGTTLPVDGPGS